MAREQIQVCRSHTHLQRMLEQDPGFRDRRARLEQQTRSYAASNPAGRTGITVIPIVVHVVHNAPDENISDAQIQSQIDVLNRDFRMTNPDVANTPAPFLPFVADARLEFELASIDPNGNPTNGITRTQTTKAGFVDDNTVKHAATGGADAWPTDRYLNIWVCNLLHPDPGFILLGYAQFPGEAAATDGVVMRYKAFGTTGAAEAPFNLGRIAVHEIGHWLNLFHIWGDDDFDLNGDGQPDIDPCGRDDEVADTPLQRSPSSGIPTFPQISCNNGPNGDMFMNHMDYSHDAAKTMFTHGQVLRIHATLDNVRTALGKPQSTPPIPIPPTPVPVPYPGRLLKYPPYTKGEDVRVWQAKMAERGYTITVDGIYGPQSKGVCTEFQRQRALQVDGIVGPITWAATFAPLRVGV